MRCDPHPSSRRLAGWCCQQAGALAGPPPPNHPTTITHAHLHLKSVLGAGQRARHHPRIQDEKVKAGQGGRQVSAQRVHRGQVSQVQALDGDLALCL